MIVAVNRTQGRAANSGHMFDPADFGALLDHPEAQPLIARLGAQVSEFSTVDRVEHVCRIAAVVLRAKRAPLNQYAKATL